MSGIFSKFKGGASSSSSPGIGSSQVKRQEGLPELTPLEKMLQNAGPIRPDGSDKFFGMENFGNTCYCNSIVQALYYSIPFREHVVRYPSHSTRDIPNGHSKVNLSAKAPNGNATSPANPKGISASEALKRRSAASTTAPPTGPPGTRPEDKPDSPEYKKKHAMLAGPILDLTYENACTYGMEESTFTALKDIFMAAIESQSRKGVISPHRFLEIFKRDNEMFRTSMHQDAHEFYGLVLNAVITNVEDNTRRIQELEAPQQDDGLPQAIASAVSNAASAVANAASAMGAVSGVRSPGKDWVRDAFESILTSETKCLTCETTSQREETFLDLSIDLEEHSSVTSCLQKFSAEEMLCERNKFHCDNCGGLQEAEKRVKIKRLPKIMTLHLKRFKWTEDNTRLQKLFHRVVYPYHLRMFNTTDDAEDADRLYELYAVVVHIGGNAYHGHYISIIKTQDRGWLLFDDEMVEPVDKHYVRNFFGDKPGMACAYVLFYQETTLEAVQREQDAEGLAEVAVVSEEAGIALGHPQPNGIHPSSGSKQVSIPNTPVDEQGGLVSLDHAIATPFPQPLSAGTSQANHAPTVSMTHPPAESKKMDNKVDREQEKKEIKEAEKARKAADKEKARAEDRKKKELEAKRKENLKTQAADLTKGNLAAGRLSTTEDEEKQPRVSAEARLPTEKKENGFIGGLSLNRSNRGSKSLSRKSFGWLKHGDGSKDSNGTAIEGSDAVPPTPEKPSKERFSFGLGKKKSSMNLL